MSGRDMEETRYLEGIPGMVESILEGAKEPEGELLSEEEVWE